MPGKRTASQRDKVKGKQRKAEGNDEKQQIKKDVAGASFNEEHALIKEMFLVDMPADFYHLWQFATSVNPANPSDAFAEIGLLLVGPFDILAKKLDRNSALDEEELLRYWRFYFDVPEFQTVLYSPGKDLYHIGYLRDDPHELPAVVCSNSAAAGCRYDILGDNLFAAVTNFIETAGRESSSRKKMAARVLSELQAFASRYGHSLARSTARTKHRQKTVVAKTFHGAGIVVPVQGEVGYRDLQMTDAQFRSLIQAVGQGGSGASAARGKLEEHISFVQMANDECDYGMGLEFGIDLFCSGEPLVHRMAIKILSCAYSLLGRSEFDKILTAHLHERHRHIADPRFSDF